MNAAFGLVQLRHIDQAIARRGELDARYRTRLMEVPGLSCPPVMAPGQANFAYFPVLVGERFGTSLDARYHALRGHGIMVRRYFYPLISSFPMYRGLPSARPDTLPVATDAANRILCLPIYPNLTDAEQDRVIDLIVQAASGG